jgi:hypothetical protein
MEICPRHRPSAGAQPTIAVRSAGYFTTPIRRSGSGTPASDPFDQRAFWGNFVPPIGIKRQALASIFFAAIAGARVQIVGGSGQPSEPALPEQEGQHDSLAGPQQGGGMGETGSG